MGINNDRYYEQIGRSILAQLKSAHFEYYDPLDPSKKYGVNDVTLEDATGIAKVLLDSNFNMDPDDIKKGAYPNDVLKCAHRFMDQKLSSQNTISGISNAEIEKKSSERVNEISNEKKDIDKRIDYIYRLVNEHSVQKNAERMKLQGKKKELPEDKVKGFFKKYKNVIMASALVVGSLGVAYVGNGISDAMKYKTFEENLGMAASNGGSNSPIVYQNTHRTIDNENFYHDNLGNARGVLTVIEKNPELLDASLISVYNSIMNHNPNTLDKNLKEMDEVFIILKQHIFQDESLKPVFDNISDCKVFLDYVFKLGLIDEQSENYYSVKSSIEEYKNSGSSLNNIPKFMQDWIEELMNKYWNTKKELCDKYSDAVEELAQQEKTESRGLGG